VVSQVTLLGVTDGFETPFNDTVPPLPEMETALPTGDTPMLLVIPMETAPAAPDASVRFKTATVPSPIVFWFNPVSRQDKTPTLEAHVMVFPAETAAGPALEEIAAILLEGL
jgi:hypothetical protein